MLGETHESVIHGHNTIPVYFGWTIWNMLILFRFLDSCVVDNGGVSAVFLDHLDHHGHFLSFKRLKYH